MKTGEQIKRSRTHASPQRRFAVSTIQQNLLVLAMTTTSRVGTVCTATIGMILLSCFELELVGGEHVLEPLGRCFGGALECVVVHVDETKSLRIPVRPFCGHSLSKQQGTCKQ